MEEIKLTQTVNVEETLEKPSREDLEEELKLLKLDINVNKGRIQIAEAYLKAGVFNTVGFPSKKEAENTILGWEDVIKEQESKILELETQIAKL